MIYNKSYFKIPLTLISPEIITKNTDKKNYDYTYMEIYSEDGRYIKLRLHYKDV